MANLSPLKRSWQWLRFWVWTLQDALPPYHHAEGPLARKERGPDGKFYVRVGAANVQVDSATFDTLVEGERLRVRYTRGSRAINIDRLVPPDELE